MMWLTTVNGTILTTQYDGGQESKSLIANRVFSKCTRMAIMSILASEALFRESKKKSVTKCYPSEY